MLRCVLTSSTAWSVGRSFLWRLNACSNAGICSTGSGRFSFNFRYLPTRWATNLKIYTKKTINLYFQIKNCSDARVPRTFSILRSTSGSGWAKPSLSLLVILLRKTPPGLWPWDVFQRCTSASPRCTCSSPRFKSSCPRCNPEMNIFIPEM